MVDDYFASLPVGFGMALIANERARAGYEALTETEKEHIILKCRDAKSRKEMDRIVASLIPPQTPAGIFDGRQI